VILINFFNKICICIAFLILLMAKFGLFNFLGPGNPASYDYLCICVCVCVCVCASACFQEWERERLIIYCCYVCIWKKGTIYKVTKCGTLRNIFYPCRLRRRWALENMVLTVCFFNWILKICFKMDQSIWENIFCQFI